MFESQRNLIDIELKTAFSYQLNIYKLIHLYFSTYSHWPLFGGVVRGGGGESYGHCRVSYISFAYQKKTNNIKKTQGKV